MTYDARQEIIELVADELTGESLGTDDVRHALISANRAHELAELIYDNVLVQYEVENSE